VIVLSDHGENLGDHGHLTHIFNVYDSNVKIPMIARGPGFPVGTVDERLVSILDVYPTLLAACGLGPDPRAVGHDLRGSIPDDRIVRAPFRQNSPHCLLGIAICHCYWIKIVSLTFGGQFASPEVSQRL